MPRMVRLVTVGLSVILLLGIVTSAAFAQDPDQGQVVWEEETACQRCHGDAGQGAWAGPLAGTESSAQEWIEQVRNPRRNMPHFTAEQVSDQQIIDMQAYMASLSRPADFSPNDPGLPADAPAGQQLLVENRCVACHGTTGPINGFIDRGEVPTAEAVISQVRSPRRAMPMFTEDQVSDAELTQIADFMAEQVSSQLAPATLPTSGGTNSSPWPLLLLLGGAGLLASGFVLRKVAR